MSSTTENMTTKSASSTPPDREALSLMTKLKLNRFKLQKRKFEDEYTEIITRQNSSTISLYDKIDMLSMSVEKLLTKEDKDQYLKNFDAVMTIAKANTSTSNNLLENLYQQLMKIIIGGKKTFRIQLSIWLNYDTMVVRTKR